MQQVVVRLTGDHATTARDHEAGARAILARDLGLDATELRLALRLDDGRGARARVCLDGVVDVHERASQNAGEALSGGCLAAAGHADEDHVGGLGKDLTLDVIDERDVERATLEEFA